METFVQLKGMRAFTHVHPDKQQALKPLEEAAEVFGAWLRWCEIDPDFGLTTGFEERDILDECADVVQAVVNLAASMGVSDLTPYLAAASAGTGSWAGSSRQALPTRCREGFFILRKYSNHACIYRHIAI